jgi:putative phosphoribosyl transferase
MTGASDAPFQDRREAAQELARALEPYRGRYPLVLGIPRGGVVMADVLARELGGDLDVALVRKLRAPDHAELAIGSVTEQGLVVLNQGWERLASEPYVRAEIEEALELLRKRREACTPHRAPIPPAGRVTIVVDDGIATGATMLAAVRSLKASGAARIVAAAAVAPPQSMNALRREADDVVVLRTPDPFGAVSLYFRDFSEVTDEEATALLGDSLPLYHGNFGIHPPRSPP